jgi:pyridoxamine 5'-phosphate oxidase
MDTLPRPAPDDPLPLAAAWLADAKSAVGKNPWAMALASVAPTGRPSVRYVLLKQLQTPAGCLVFYTNYGSRKASELEPGGFGAGTLYWPEAGRQLRFEGRVERAPAADSDAYFASRPRLSRLNAWASEQSRPIDSPDALAAKLAAAEARFANREIPRPDGWGGYRLWIDRLEFWLEGADRCHERLGYARTADGNWQQAWLQP